MDYTKRKIPDYFAELYVAGRLADAGWNVYFPHRDQGFDFIISKKVGEKLIIRPVQVKGKYPTREKTDKGGFGFIGKLTSLHSDMVLAIPYFSSDQTDSTPVCVAYIPSTLIKEHPRGYRCEPASFKGGLPKKKEIYASFFDNTRVERLESEDWSKSILKKEQA